LRRELEEASEFTAREVQLRSAGRLAAEFAHQIKNPLAIMNTALFSLQRALKENRIDDANDDPVPALGGRVPLEWFDGGPIEDEFPGYEAFGRRQPPPSHLYVTPGAERLVELALPALDEAWRTARLESAARP